MMILHGDNSILKSITDENKKLKEALQFYADIDNWKLSGEKESYKFTQIINDIGEGEFTIDDETDENVGGKLARRVLNELREGGKCES